MERSHPRELVHGFYNRDALEHCLNRILGVLQGFVLVALGANVLFYGLFYAGRGIARTLQGVSKDKNV